LRGWLQSFKKVLIGPKQICSRKSKRDQETQNFMLILNPLKTFFFKCTKKSYKQTSFTNMSKSEKSAYFITLLLTTFQKKFQRIGNQREISRF
jgi:hypothetical protein